MQKAIDIWNKGGLHVEMNRKNKFEIDPSKETSYCCSRYRWDLSFFSDDSWFDTPRFILHRHNQLRFVDLEFNFYEQNMRIKVILVGKHSKPKPSAISVKFKEANLRTLIQFDDGEKQVDEDHDIRIVKTDISSQLMRKFYSVSRPIIKIKFNFHVSITFNAFDQSLFS